MDDLGFLLRRHNFFCFQLHFPIGLILVPSCSQPQYRQPNNMQILILFSSFAQLGSTEKCMQHRQNHRCEPNMSKMWYAKVSVLSGWGQGNGSLTKEKIMALLQ